MIDDNLNRETLPLTAVGDGRQANGRFGAGNRFGSGNPNNKRAQEIRHRLLKRLDDEQLDEIIDTLIGQAKGGDIRAVREIFDRTIGKPREAEPDQDQPDGREYRIRLVDHQLTPERAQGFLSALEAGNTGAVADFLRELAG